MVPTLISVSIHSDSPSTKSIFDGVIKMLSVPCFKHNVQNSSVMITLYCCRLLPVCPSQATLSVFSSKTVEFEVVFSPLALCCQNAQHSAFQSTFEKHQWVCYFAQHSAFQSTFEKHQWVCLLLLKWNVVGFWDYLEFTVTMHYLIRSLECAVSTDDLLDSPPR